MQRTITIDGEIIGTMWMPAAKGWRPVPRESMEQYAARCVGDIDIRDYAVHMLLDNGGDFQSCQFSADTLLTVELSEMVTGQRIPELVTRRRTVFLRDLPNVADLVGDDYPDYADD